MNKPFSRCEFLKFTGRTAFVLAAWAVAAGSALAQGKDTSSDKALVYLYRKASLYAVAARYKVIDGGTNQVLGEMYNASYLQLRLDPGRHLITVEEGGDISAKSFEIQAQAGKCYFVEFDSSKGWLLGWGFPKPATAQSEAQALADLKDLRRTN